MTSPKPPSTTHHVETFWHHVSNVEPKVWGWQCLTCDAEADGFTSLAAAENDPVRLHHEQGVLSLGCEHLDGPYRRLLAERDRLAGALAAVREVVATDAAVHGGPEYSRGRADVARAVLRALDALTTPTDEETTRG